MKSIIVMNCCVALLLTIVSTKVEANSMGEVLKAMVKNEETIDNRFKPLKNGALGETYVYCKYKGILLLNNKEVVMTFTKRDYREEAENEYKMYTYLNAINNQSAENYGIPAVYYYGEWNYHIMMATTIRESEMCQRFWRNFNELDLMIACREFVLTAKFMHSRGVYNNDFRIMFYKNQFLMEHFTHGKDLSKASHHDKLIAAQDDFNEFFSEMFLRFASEKRWDWLGYSGKDAGRMRYFPDFVSVLRQDSAELNSLTGLRKVFVAFATYAYDTDESKIMFYDELYGVIAGEIQKYEKKTKKPAVFSCLSKEDKAAAEEFNKHLPSIKGIKDPFGNYEIVHGPVEFDFFDKLYGLKTQPKKTLQEHLGNE